MDRQFISYPKSGRSWVRYSLHLLGLESQIKFHHDGCEFSDPSMPALQLDFGRREDNCLSRARIVYMDRDPRDHIVSLFFQVTGRMRDVFDFGGTISDFVRDEYFGIENLCEFRWQWNRLCEQGHALRITYEACHDDFGEVVRNVVRWYGFEVAEREVKVACENAGFDKMRAVELAGTFGEPWLRPRNGSPKTRTGIVGSYRAVLSEADLAFIEEVLQRKNGSV